MLLWTSIMAFAQSPISSFYPVSGSNYAIVVPASSIDQSAAGANVMWDFTNLTPVGSSYDENTTPTAQEIADFPNTTNATQNTSTVNMTTNVSSVYSKNISNEISITGIYSPQVTLNFATNNAKLGTFPLNYGYSFTDNLAGTYSYDTYNGTLTGTITTSVDAYGTLMLTIAGMGSTSETVTRLKSEQNINLNYGFFMNVGTIHQTLYSYYVAGNNSPVFRTSTTAVNVPLLSIDQTGEQYERFVGVLGINENVAAANTVSVYPNPAEDVLNINNQTAHSITGITVTDMSGRIVIQKKGEVTTLLIGHLQKGLYTATIITDSGSFIKKIMKQ